MQIPMSTWKICKNYIALTFKYDSKGLSDWVELLTSGGSHQIRHTVDNH